MILARLTHGWPEASMNWLLSVIIQRDTGPIRRYGKSINVNMRDRVTDIN